MHINAGRDCDRQGAYISPSFYDGRYSVIVFSALRGDVKIHQGPSQPFSHYCQLGYIILPPFTLTQDVEGCDTYYQFASILYLDKPAAFSKEHRSLSHKMPSTNINNWIDKLPLTNIGWAIMITLSTLMCF